jgi:hypothetical protein
MATNSVLLPIHVQRHGCRSKRAALFSISDSDAYVSISMCLNLTKAQIELKSIYNRNLSEQNSPGIYKNRPATRPATASKAAPLPITFWDEAAFLGVCDGVEAVFDGEPEALPGAAEDPPVVVPIAKAWNAANVLLPVVAALMAPTIPFLQCLRSRVRYEKKKVKQ